MIGQIRTKVITMIFVSVHTLQKLSIIRIYHIDNDC